MNQKLFASAFSLSVLWSLQSSETWWLVTPKRSLQVQHSPSCVELHFGFGPLFNHPAWDLGKCSCCTQSPSLGNHFIHTAKGSNWVKPSHPWDVQQMLWIQVKDLKLLLLPAPWKELAQACTEPGRGWPSPDRVGSCARGLVRGEAPSSQSRQCVWPVAAGAPAPIEAAGSAEHAGRFLLPLFFPGVAFHPGFVSFPPAERAKGGLACTPLGWPGGIPVRRAGSSCGHIQLELGVHRDKSTNYK